LLKRCAVAWILLPGHMAGAELQTSESFYEILDGSIYDKSLLVAAEEIAKDGVIGYEDAKLLWTKVGSETGQVSDVDVRTVDYIKKRYKCEIQAKFFLDEAIKTAKRDLKVKIKEDAKALGSPVRKSPMKSKSSPKGFKGDLKPGEDPYQAVLRITEEIGQATSLTAVQRLQKQLARLSPMKEKADGEVATPPKKSAGRGRGRGRSTAAGGSLRKAVTRKLKTSRQAENSDKPVRKGKKSLPEDEAAAEVIKTKEMKAVLKRPAKQEVAPTVEENEDAGEEDEEDEDDEEEEDEFSSEDDDDDEEEEEEDDDEDEEIPAKVLKRPAGQSKKEEDKAKESPTASSRGTMLKRPAAASQPTEGEQKKAKVKETSENKEAPAKRLIRRASVEEENKPSKVLKKPAAALPEPAAVPSEPDAVLPVAKRPAAAVVLRGIDAD